MGVITEATVKLHRWAGGDWPQEMVYDRPPLPKNHRIFYIEYPDFKSTEEGLYEISHSGIGTHLNTIPDAFNAFNTQPTQALSEKTLSTLTFPSCRSEFCSRVLTRMYPIFCPAMLFFLKVSV